jgi:hypothetical protein
MGELTATRTSVTSSNCVYERRAAVGRGLQDIDQRSGAGPVGHGVQRHVEVADRDVVGQLDVDLSIFGDLDTVPVFVSWLDGQAGRQAGHERRGVVTDVVLLESIVAEPSAGDDTELALVRGSVAVTVTEELDLDRVMHDAGIPATGLDLHRDRARRTVVGERERLPEGAIVTRGE